MTQLLLGGFCRASCFNRDWGHWASWQHRTSLHLNLTCTTGIDFETRTTIIPSHSGIGRPYLCLARDSRLGRIFARLRRQRSIFMRLSGLELLLLWHLSLQLVSLVQLMSFRGYFCDGASTHLSRWLPSWATLHANIYCTSRCTRPRVSDHVSAKLFFLRDCHLEKAHFWGAVSLRLNKVWSWVKRGSPSVIIRHLTWLSFVKCSELLVARACLQWVTCLVMRLYHRVVKERVPSWTLGICCALRRFKNSTNQLLMLQFLRDLNAELRDGRPFVWVTSFLIH